MNTQVYSFIYTGGQVWNIDINVFVFKKINKWMNLKTYV